MADPQDILVRAVVAKWLATASLKDGIAGPFRDEKPPDLSVGFPYCVFTVDSRLMNYSCGNEYWLHEFEFRVYHRTPELVSPEAAKVVTVFGGGLSLTLSEGELRRGRLRRVRYLMEDKVVYAAILPFEFLTSKPRTG